MKPQRGNRAPIDGLSAIERLEQKGLQATGGRKVVLPAKAETSPETKTCSGCSRVLPKAQFARGSARCNKCAPGKPRAKAPKGPTRLCPRCNKQRPVNLFGPRSKYCQPCRQARDAEWKQQRAKEEQRRLEVRGGAPGLGKRR